MVEGTEILWWQWWLLIAISINTTINLIVFFKGRKLHIRELLHLKPKAKGVAHGKPSTK
jgi:uncharacterized protein YpmS